jgi:DNA polymerase III gamma/tau subunit
MLAQSIQERELNILANDAHETMANFKHEEWLVEHQKALDDMLLVHQKAIEDLNYQNSLLSMNAQIQLKLEKERMIRDYQIEEQELRIELIHMVSSKQQKDIEQKLTEDTHSIESKKEILTIKHQAELQTFKNENSFEQKKREAFIQEAKFKTNCVSNMRNQNGCYRFIKMN